MRRERRKERGREEADNPRQREDPPRLYHSPLVAIATTTIMVMLPMKHVYFHTVRSLVVVVPMSTYLLSPYPTW